MKKNKSLRLKKARRRRKKQRQDQIFNGRIATVINNITRLNWRLIDLGKLKSGRMIPCDLKNTDSRFFIRDVKTNKIMIEGTLNDIEVFYHKYWGLKAFI